MTAADLLSILEEQLAAARADRDARPLERARVIARLAAVAHRVIESGNLEQRLRALEEVLKVRRGPK